jgi:GT2 family glycosyltransferase
MRIGAGILHYRFWPDVRRTLDALLAQTRLPDVLLVVDNGSDDGSTDSLRQAYPDIGIVAISPNRGPIAGLNAVYDALAERGVDAALALTHDTVLAPDALELLAARLEGDQSLGAVGPLLCRDSKPDEVWSAGGTLDRGTWLVGHIVEPRERGAWEGRGPHQVDWLEGSATLVRMDARAQTGRFHEEFFALYDEIDHQIRMREHGWRVECVPAAVAWQEPGAYSPYMWVRNRLGFLARHAPKRFVARDLARVGYHVVRDAARPQTKDTRAELPLRMRGVLDFARGRWGPPPA